MRFSAGVPWYAMPAAHNMPSTGCHGLQRHRLPPRAQAATPDPTMAQECPRHPGRSELAPPACWRSTSHATNWHAQTALIKPDWLRGRQRSASCPDRWDRNRTRYHRAQTQVRNEVITRPASAPPNRRRARCQSPAQRRPRGSANVTTWPAKPGQVGHTTQACIARTQPGLPIHPGIVPAPALAEFSITLGNGLSHVRPDQARGLRLRFRQG